MARIADSMPVQRGNVKLSNLQSLNALLYVADHGSKWRGLPEHFGHWHTIYTRMNRWSRNGVLDRIFEKLHLEQIVRIRIEAIALDSTSIKVHPDGTGAFEKADHRPSARAAKWLVMTGAMVMCGVLGQMAVAQQTAAAQEGATAEVQHAYAGLKANILKAAHAMPAEEYSFKPMPDVRTFARVVNHITEAQDHACGVLNGKPTSFVPPETANKGEIVKALESSFAACDMAFGTMSDRNATEMIATGPGSKRSRIGLLWGTVSHDNEQYATLAVYMRLKGLTPPSSEK